MACHVLHKQAILMIHVGRSLFSYLQGRGSGKNYQPRSNNSNTGLSVSIRDTVLFQVFPKKTETGLLAYSCHEGMKSKRVLNPVIGRNIPKVIRLKLFLEMVTSSAADVNSHVA